MEMTSSAPYLLRAFHEWIVDNGCTPYVVIDANAAGTSVPVEHVKEGRIVLDISSSAVRDLQLTNELIAFNGRFGGVPRAVYAPITAVVAIYARENGQGMWFPQGAGTDDSGPEPDPPGKPTGSGPSLKIVK